MTLYFSVVDKRRFKILFVPNFMIFKTFDQGLLESGVKKSFHFLVILTNFDKAKPHPYLQFSISMFRC